MTEDQADAEPEREPAEADRPDPDAPVNAGPLTCWGCRRVTIVRRGKWWFESGSGELHTCAGPGG